MIKILATAATLALTGIVAFAAVQTPTAKTTTAAVPTFSKDVAPILYQNCTTCHRSGEVAPFPIADYGDAKKRAQLIADVTQSRYMPPWKADSHGEFQDERRLTDAQIATLQQWAAHGAPEGDTASLPPVPHFTPGWRLGPPDLIAQPTEAYTLASDGSDVYRSFVLPTHYDEDRWVTGIEVRPGNAKVVHHVIAYLDTSGKARVLDAQDPGPGYTSFGGGIGVRPSGALGGWAPGMDPRLLPSGDGILLPKGADIVLQVHYHKSGKPEADLTKIGLYFSKVPVDKRVRILPIVDPALYIKPGDAHFMAHATAAIPQDITVLQVMPHMHLLGHDMAVTATLPDGAQKSLVSVPDWDFNWQMFYAYKEPLKLPHGTQIGLVAHYDNSASNIRNPNSPPKLVTWGEQTTDEMCIAFVAYTIDSEHLTEGVVAQDIPMMSKEMVTRFAPEFVQWFDKDKDGKLDVAELSPIIDMIQQRSQQKFVRQILGDPDMRTKIVTHVLKQFDADGDGQLNADEVATLMQAIMSRKTETAAR